MSAPSCPLSPSLPLRLVDSVTELTAADAGCLAVTGSHGGLSAARYARAVRPALAVFNDAGVGLRQAGIAGLAELDAADLAACTVSHLSACIGQARSTWEEGVVSHTNRAAARLGLKVGQPLRGQLVRWGSGSGMGRHILPVGGQGPGEGMERGAG